MGGTHYALSYCARNTRLRHANGSALEGTQVLATPQPPATVKDNYNTLLYC